MDINESNTESKMNEEQLKRILLRAFMRGENISNVNPEDFIADIAKNIKGNISS